MYRSSKSLAISLTPLVVFYLLKTEWGHFLEKKSFIDRPFFKSTSKPNSSREMSIFIAVVVTFETLGMDSMLLEIRLKTP